MSTTQTSFLKSASDFEIIDGHFSSIGRDSSSFTARDVHLTINNHYSSSPTSSQSSSSPNPVPTNVFNVDPEQDHDETTSALRAQSQRRRSSSEDNDMAQSNVMAQESRDIYRTRLATKGRGLPLWIPEPSQSLPIQYQRQGISLGDVGVVTNAGSFTLLFNIFLPINHPINPPIMPEGFKPLQVMLTYGAVSVQRESKDNSYLASPSRLRAERKEGSSNLIFKSSKADGAILTMPVGAKKEELLCIARLRKYVNVNMADWYRYAYRYRGMELQNGDLKVVTGCDKTSAWGMACLGLSDNPTQEADPTTDLGVHRFHLKFGPTAKEDRGGGRYKWTYSGEVAEARAGPDWSEVAQLRTTQGHGDVERQEDSPEHYENQCLFLRTMNAMLSKEMWEKLMSEQEEEDDTSETEEFGSDTRYGHRYSGHPRGTDQRSGAHGEESQDGRQGGSQHEGGDFSTSRAYSVLNASFNIPPTVSSMASLADHPSIAINKFLLKNCSEGVTMAISLDQDWISVLREDDVILPSSEELLERILEHHVIHEEEGIAFFDTEYDVSDNDNNPHPSPRLDVAASFGDMHMSVHTPNWDTHLPSGGLGVQSPNQSPQRQPASSSPGLGSTDSLASSSSSPIATGQPTATHAGYKFVFPDTIPGDSSVSGNTLGLGGLGLGGGGNGKQRANSDTWGAGPSMGAGFGADVDAGYELFQQHQQHTPSMGGLGVGMGEISMDSRYPGYSQMQTQQQQQSNFSQFLHPNSPLPSLRRSLSPNLAGRGGGIESGLPVSVGHFHRVSSGSMSDRGAGVWGSQSFQHHSSASLGGGGRGSGSSLGIRSVNPYPSPNGSPRVRYEELQEQEEDTGVDGLGPGLGLGGYGQQQQYNDLGGGRGFVGPEIGEPPVGAGYSEENFTVKQDVTTGRMANPSTRRRKQSATFVCTVPGCNSTFTRGFSLKKHLRSHYEQKPYKCHWPGCGKGFARQHDCKRHAQRHSNFRPFECEGCRKQFARMDVLNMHLRSEAGAECARAVEKAREGGMMGGGPGVMMHDGNGEMNMSMDVKEDEDYEKEIKPPPVVVMRSGRQRQGNGEGGGNGGSRGGAIGDEASVAV